jgi:hypothetical protein
VCSIISMRMVLLSVLISIVDIVKVCRGCDRCVYRDGQGQSLTVYVSDSVVLVLLMR